MSSDRKILKSAFFEGADELAACLTFLIEAAITFDEDLGGVAVESAGFALQGYAVLIHVDDDIYTIEIVDKATPEILATEASQP